MYIKHSFDVKLGGVPIQIFPNENTGALLHPYKNVEISIREEYSCPFCGEVVHGFKCQCETFNQAFRKLQESRGDENHKSSFHGPELAINYGIIKSIPEFNVKTLNKEEILGFGLDVWDDAVRYSDRLSGESYAVTPATPDGENLFFLCKDLLAKHVYRFEIPKPEYKNRQICFGTLMQKTVSDGSSEKLGNYHFEHYWKDFKTFEDWNEVCKTLIEL